MSKQNTKGITVKKADDMSEWYGQVVIKAEVADYGPIRGFMVIRPRGYGWWEHIQDFFNQLIKANGVRNAYFPLLIPESFFKKEAEHAEGFAPEVAWVENTGEGQERLAIRPTSETIMYDSYSRWIRSWRDLPLKINQWCNIVRWEVKDTKIFLRSREFLWQEGHCVYDSEKECDKDTLLYLEMYRKVAEELLAVPVIMGRKTDFEKFPGAERSYTIEGFMPDGKALQMGTSHMLGQGFAKAFEIKYLDKDEKWKEPWQNSWGFSTRLLGSVILQHGDDNGLVLPPKIAENKVAVVPILMKEKSLNEKTLAVAQDIVKELKSFDAILDDRTEISAGWKFNEHELKGVPLRIEIGPRDIESKQVVIVRRDTKEKLQVPIKEVRDTVKRTLDMIQDGLYNVAKKNLDDNTVVVASWDEFVQADKDKKMILANHCGSQECEQVIKDETQGVTSRCIPFKNGKADGNCVKCSEKAKYKVYFARAY